MHRARKAREVVVTESVVSYCLRSAPTVSLEERPQRSGIRKKPVNLGHHPMKLLDRPKRTPKRPSNASARIAIRFSSPEMPERGVIEQTAHALPLIRRQEHRICITSAGNA